MTAPAEAELREAKIERDDMIACALRREVDLSRAEAEAAALRERVERLEARERQHEQRRINDLAMSRGCNMRGIGISECSWPCCPCPIASDPRAAALLPTPDAGTGTGE